MRNLSIILSWMLCACVGGSEAGPDPFDEVIGVDLDQTADELGEREILADVTDRHEFVEDESVQGATESAIVDGVMTTAGTAYFTRVEVGEKIWLRIEGSGFWGAEMAFLVKYRAPGSEWRVLRIPYTVDGVFGSTSYEARYFKSLLLDPQADHAVVNTEYSGSAYPHAVIDLPKGVPLELAIFPFPLSDWGSEAGRHTYTFRFSVEERDRVVCAETRPADNLGPPFRIEAHVNFARETVYGWVWRGTGVDFFNREDCIFEDGRFRCDDNVDGLHFVIVPYVRTESGVARAPGLRQSDGAAVRFFAGPNEFSTAPVAWRFHCQG